MIGEALGFGGRQAGTMKGGDGGKNEAELEEIASWQKERQAELFNLIAQYAGDRWPAFCSIVRNLRDGVPQEHDEKIYAVLRT